MTRRLQIAPSAALPVLLLLAAACAQPGSSSSWVRIEEGGSTVERSGDELEVRWKDGGVDTLVDVEGEPELDDSQTDVVGFRAGGSLRVRTRGEGPRRDLVIEASDEGVLRRYSVDGEEVDWDPAAAEWFAGVLDELTARTGLGALARAEHILAEGGPMALALEIGRVEPGAGQRVYLERLLDEPRLEKDVLITALDAAPRMASESSRAFLAARVAPHDPADTELTARLLDVAAGISSSSTRAELLDTLVVQRKLDPVLLERAIRVAGGISNESARAAALVKLAPLAANAPVELAWISAARSITNSTLKSETLQAFLERRESSPRAQAAVIEAAATISSESARAAALETCLARLPADEAARAKWIEAVATISSSNLKAEALSGLLVRTDVSPANYAQAVKAAAAISNENSRSELLVLAARGAPVEALDEVLEATATLTNSSLRAAPLVALLERNDLDSGTLDRVAEVIAGISSDSTRAEVQELLIAKLAAPR